MPVARRCLTLTKAGRPQISSAQCSLHQFIANTDRFALGHGAKTLLWTAQTDGSGIPAAEALLGGFGDPAIPRSPNAIAAGIAAVPKPQTYALLLAGLAAVLAAVRFGPHARQDAGRSGRV